MPGLYAKVEPRILPLERKEAQLPAAQSHSANLRRLGRAFGATIGEAKRTLRGLPKALDAVHACKALSLRLGLSTTPLRGSRSRHRKSARIALQQVQLRDRVPAGGRTAAEIRGGLLDRAQKSRH